MPTVVIAVLVVLFVVVLASNWLSARRDHDPASSVDSFSRALSAMGRGAEEVPGAVPEGAPQRQADDVTRT